MAAGTARTNIPAPPVVARDEGRFMTLDYLKGLSKTNCTSCNRICLLKILYVRTYKRFFVMLI